MHLGIQTVVHKCDPVPSCLRKNLLRNLFKVQILGPQYLRFLFSGSGKSSWNLHLKNKIGTSLVVQWVRLHAPNAGGLGSIPGWGTRYHMHATTKSLQTTQLRVHMLQLKDPASREVQVNSVLQSLVESRQCWKELERQVTNAPMFGK